MCLQSGTLHHYVNKAIITASHEDETTDLSFKIIQKIIKSGLGLRRHKNETYVSLIHSTQTALPDKLKDCLLYVMKKPKLQKRFGFIEIYVAAVLSDLNDEKDLIKFCWEPLGNDTQTAKHAGLYYFTDEDNDEDNIVTKLSESLAEGSGQFIECEKTENARTGRIKQGNIPLTL